MNQQPVRVAVVGVGYFGSLHCQKLAGLPNTKLVAVVDQNQRRANEIAARFGSEALSSHNDLIDRVQGAIVSTPASTHGAIAADLLSGGVDVFIEKPFTTSLSEAERLCRLAAERAAVLQVGHLERYNPAAIAALQMISAPRYIRLERCGPFLNRIQDIDVVFDLMVHDLDLLLQVDKAPVASCSAVGFSIVTKYLDLVCAQILFEDGLAAELMASRVSPDKTRRLRVLDSNGWIDADLAGGQIKRSPILEGQGKPQAFTPPKSDPLLEQDRAFIESIISRRPPLVDGVAGKSVVALAERVRASANANIVKK